MQHRLQKQSIDCRNGAEAAEIQHQPIAEMQHKLQRCITRCKYAPLGTEMQDQVHRGSTRCRSAAPDAELQHQLQR